MAQKSIKKLYPKIEGDSKFGFGKITFIASDTEPTGACEGAVYFDSSEKTLKVYTSDLAWVALSAAVGAAGTGLDNAYDINPNITVDGTTITLTGSSADVLTIVQTANNDGLYISKTGTGSGAALNILNVGTGVDIYGSGGNFQVTKAGAVTAAGITATDLTLTASTVSITGDATTGTIATIVADTLTTGKGLVVSMAAASNAELIDCLINSTSVFEVKDTGALTIAGSAEGTDYITITAGDLKLTDGDINITSGQFTMTGDANADVMTITGPTTGNYDVLYVNGTTNDGSGSIIKVAQGAATRTGPMVDLDMGTTAVAMEAIDIDCTGGTRTVPIISIDSDGTASDFISLINGVVFTGNYIDCQQHAGAATGNFIFLNNDSGTGLTSINIDDDASLVDTILCTTSAAIGAAKAVFHVVSTGTPNATANAILVNWTGVTATNTPYMVKLDSSSKDIAALSIDSDNATDSTVLINCGGNLANDKALLELTWDGTPANAGTNMLRVDGSGGTNTVKPVLVEIYDDSVAVGLSVNTASIEDVVSITGSGATGANKSVVDINWGAVTPNAAGNLLRLDCTAATTTSVPICFEVVGAGEVARAIYTDVDCTSNHSVQFHCGGALTDGYGVVGITNDGNLATGGNLLNVTVGGTPNAAAIAVEVQAAKDCQALFINTAAATDSAIEITGTGAVADNKALLELNWTSTPAAAGSNMLRVDGSGGTNTAKPVLVEIYDDSVSVGLSVSTASIEDMVTFIGTGATGAAKAVIDVTSTAALNATANLLRLDLTGADTTSVPTALEIVGAGETARGIYVDTDGTTVGAAAFHSGGALTDGIAVVNITNDGNLATGGNLLNVTMGGTPHTAAAAVEIVASKDAKALDITTSAATNSAVKITGVGAIANDMALLHVSHGTGAIVAGGSLVRIEGNANAGGATAYGMTINCNATNLEALWVEAGTVKFAETLEVTGASTLTGKVTCTAGCQSAAVAVTATAAGAAIPDGTAFVTTTAGSDANCIIILPTPTPGNVIYITGNATGYELRSSDPATIAINGGTGSAAESAVAANEDVWVRCRTATAWVANKFDADGDEAKLEAAAN